MNDECLINAWLDKALAKMYFVACEDERTSSRESNDEAVDSRSLTVILARESGNEDEQSEIFTRAA